MVEIPVHPGQQDIKPCKITTPRIIATREFLLTTFQNIRFQERIAKLARFSHRKHIESGFVARNVKGRLRLSGIIKGDAESLSSLDLVRVGINYNIIPPGITVVAHAHTVFKKRREIPDQLLGLSEGDLTTWEEERITTRNPSLIEAVVVPFSSQVAKVLLAQLDPSREANTYYQQWKEYEGREALFELLSQSGFRYDVLTFHMSHGFPKEEIEKAARFGFE